MNALDFIEENIDDELSKEIKKLLKLRQVSFNNKNLLQLRIQAFLRKL